MVCKRLDLPQTAYALDLIRPDLLLFRALARCLVLWDDVKPTDAWIDSQIPVVILHSLFPNIALPPSSSALLRGRKVLDPRPALMLYLNIISGHCWGIGLIFAGTADSAAKDTLLAKLKMLQGFRDNKLPFSLPFIPHNKALRPLVEACICTVSLSLACVMAGTGDLSCLRILRSLRWKVDDVTYGTHLALAMAIGLLFLSGGSASLRRDPRSCACLLLATAPRFPARTVDNQYHLQALRHLYVLAVEERALHVIDVDSGNAVSLDIDVELVCGRNLIKRAPCLLPELTSVRSIRLAEESSSSRPLSSSSAPSLSSPLSLYFPTSLVISSPSSNYSSIPHPLYVKRRALSSSSRAHAIVHNNTSCNSSSSSRYPSSPSTLLRSLKGRLAGGRQQSMTHGSGAHNIQEIGVGGEEARLAFHYLVSSATICIDDHASNFKGDRIDSVIDADVGMSRTGQDQVLESTSKKKTNLTPSTYFRTMGDVSLALMCNRSIASEIYLEAIRESNE